ncbi:MAG: M20 family metallo-hydrolase [Methanomassiliicoccaceae archaeon]|jgi:succinyl-diaminopimelate desuccinylase|nr:M20 family metallo-hydrolase [Methanomassiliicoccaceae archaeon]
MRLEDILKKIETSRDDMISDMMAMIRIPAIGPLNGGKGEGLRADKVTEFLKGYDSIERVDVKDIHEPTVLRPNILAKKKGKGKGTVWIISHLDTVLPGDLDEWKTPPYEPVVKDGRIYGLGTEDNGQAVISSIYASKFFDRGTLTRKSIGLAIVADEETTSTMGIEHLINAGLFGPDDVFIVPDWGVPGGTMVAVAEKHLIWLKFAIEGKQTHGSTPQKGLNAYRVSAKLLVDVMDRLEKKYPDNDQLFRPQVSTFEPTKSIATVGNINTIPGYHEFCLDIRLLPSYDPDDLVAFAKEVGAEWEKRTGAKITVSVEQRTRSGKPSDISGPEFLALRDSISSVVGKEPETVGVGGGTCANFFRLAGYNAYVWQTGGGSLHQPNEYCELSNLISDAKVFATLFHKLCV